MLYFGFWILDFGFWILDFGFWIYGLLEFSREYIAVQTLCIRIFTERI